MGAAQRETRVGTHSASVVWSCSTQVAYQMYVPLYVVTTDPHTVPEIQKLKVNLTENTAGPPVKLIRLYRAIGSV